MICFYLINKQMYSVFFKLSTFICRKPFHKQQFNHKRFNQEESHCQAANQQWKTTSQQVN